MIAITTIITSLVVYTKAHSPATETTAGSPSTSPTPALIHIDVAGSVNKPGAYTLPDGSRLGDAIERAGGFTDSADQTYIQQQLNMSKILGDQEKVYIPHISEKSPTTNTSTQINAGISINTADSATLDTLPHVGEKTAETIINNRPYASLEELKDKKVLGEKTFEKLLPYISL